MKYYIIASGCDCDGTPVSTDEIVSRPYDSKEEAQTACEHEAEWSDGVHYMVMDQERVERNYMLELLASQD